MQRGIELTDTEVIDLGFLTTPQLFYIVNYMNNYNKGPLNFSSPKDLFTEQYYVNQATAVSQFLSELKGERSQKFPLYIDCSNGVGGYAMHFMGQKLVDLLQIGLFNNKKPNKLNDECGTEFIQVTQSLPLECSEIYKKYNGEVRFAAFDGDADRLIYL